MGYEGYDWEDDPSFHPTDCPACDTTLICAHEWNVHVDGAPIPEAQHEALPHEHAFECGECRAAASDDVVTDGGSTLRPTYGPRPPSCTTTTAKAFIQRPPGMDICQLAQRLDAHDGSVLDYQRRAERARERRARRD